MRSFERVVWKQDLSPHSKALQFVRTFAFKEGLNTTVALIKCQHHWLNWLDRIVDFVRVFSFDFIKAFDMVSNEIL